MGRMHVDDVLPASSARRGRLLLQRSPLAALIDEGRLRFVFQPIADLAGGEVFAYEALMRGPAGSPLESPEVLLRCAAEEGRLLELEIAAALGAIAAFGRLGLPGKLFINLAAPTIEAFAADRGALLFRATVEAGLAPARLMIELTEHERVEHPERLREALTVFSAQDIGLALDDFGDGRSSLRLWAQLKPAIVKLDKFFAREVHRDPRKVDVVRAMLTLAERFGTLLVAEGIETPAELAVLRDLGCRYAQGYLLGRPQAVPDAALPEEVGQLLASSKISVLPNAMPDPHPDHTVARLIVEAPTVEAEACNEDVRRVFAKWPALHAVAVVERDYPIGLIDRRTFLDRYAQPYFNELYGRRACSGLMNACPLRVDRAVPIDSMVRMLAGDDQRYLFEGFIVTDGGRYAGLATGESLVRAVTERRIEAARHANPLTLLPGNIPITEHIRRLLEAGAGFAACYFDLNNFKPYNDLYGYWRGDEMIKLAAQCILEACDHGQDFVGHVGGDDFVVLFQSEDWELRCRRAVHEFAVRARALFDDADLARGGFDSEDRRGFRVFFPLTALSVGAVEVVRGQFRSPEDVASAAAAAKKVAKGEPGGFHLQTPASAHPGGAR
ncbi:MAG: EAL domain-containing protein [Zoogloeaceae bacterium]|nr:EAL domain-containing protein [Zoogloeaceae bacterium]